MVTMTESPNSYEDSLHGVQVPFELRESASVHNHTAPTYVVQNKLSMRDM